MSEASTTSSPLAQNAPSVTNVNHVSALFRTLKRYTEISVVGTGAYGTVYKARDLHKDGQIVTMKKVEVPLTEDGLPLSTMREIALLRQLDAYKHPNIVRLLDVCHSGYCVERNYPLVLFLVFEHIEQDLESYIKRAPFPLAEDRIRRLIGRPPHHEWPNNVSIMADSFPEYPAQDLASVLPRIHPQALNLIKGMLVFDPAKRLTALDCLEHPYFTEEPLT